MNFCRFWVYCSHMDANIQVLLTSEHTASNPLVLHESHRCDDEDPSHSVELYWMEEDGIHSLEKEWGHDCDGRYWRSHEHACPYHELESGGQIELQLDSWKVSEWDGGYRPVGIRYPKWVEVSHSQRDYAAEAAGY